METNFDSEKDTLKHIKRVNQLIGLFVIALIKRGMVHDDSKLINPEKALFDELTPKLAGVSYNSPEYKEFLKELKPALDHHYAKNTHHPEHYPNGVNGMNLLDVVEMFLDWKAASERHDDGNIVRSIEINRSRFEISDQLAQIFKNTVTSMGW